MQYYQLRKDYCEATATVAGCVDGGAVAGEAMTVSCKHLEQIWWLQFSHSLAPKLKDVLHSWHAPVVGVAKADTSAFIVFGNLALSPVFLAG